MTDAGPVLARLGFELVERGVKLSRGAGPIYRGVERMYYFPNPFELSEKAERAWSLYWDAEEDGRLRSDVQAADELKDVLGEVGLGLEVIYSEVIVLPDETAVEPEALAHPFRPEMLAWLPEHSARVPPPPKSFVPMGFDISTPAPTYHSVIRNGAPGVDRYDDVLAHLNAVGLTEDLAYATELMNAANATGYRLGTFCVLRVYARDG